MPGFFSSLETKQKIAFETHVRHFLLWMKLNRRDGLETYELVNEYIRKVEKPDGVKDLFPLSFELSCELYSFIKNDRKHLVSRERLAKERNLKLKIKFLPEDQWIVPDSKPLIDPRPDDDRDPILDVE